MVQVIPNDQKEKLVPILLSLEEVPDQEKPQKRVVIPGSRLRTRAFIKVQDGCSHQCTFCITTIARGDSKSIPLENIIFEIRSALEGGSKEAVFTGVQLGSWGKDFDPLLELSDLMEGVLTGTEISRLRLSSIEPWDVSDRLIDIIQEGRVARHLHLPLQSGSRTVMRRMARAITPEVYSDLIERIRGKIPEIAITTDVMVGFPGETEAEFNESLDFIQDMHFSGGHVFTYSPREGTPAADYPDQVPYALRKKRSSIIRKVLTNSALDYREDFLGEKLPVLWERVKETKDGSWKAFGLTDNYLRVEVDASPELWNTISNVKLIGLTPKGLYGELIQN